MMFGPVPLSNRSRRVVILLLVCGSAGAVLLGSAVAYGLYRVSEALARCL